MGTWSGFPKTERRCLVVTVADDVLRSEVRVQCPIESDFYATYDPQREIFVVFIYNECMVARAFSRSELESEGSMVLPFLISTVVPALALLAWYLWR